MPSRKKTMTAASRTANPKRKRRTKRNRAGRKATGLPKVERFGATAYQRLVMDPCNGPLVRAPGFEIGADVVERVRSTYTFPRTLNSTCGYVAWFPSFHNTASGTYAPGNLYCWETTSGNIGVPPSNTTLDPMGSVPTTSGEFLPDPASAAIGSTGAFNRARTIAACMQLETLQQLSSVQGMVCTVAHMPLSAFNMNAGGTGNFTPPSVQQMLNYAASRERLSLEGHEVVWAPHERDSMLRTNGSEDTNTIFTGGSADPNSAFWRGVSGNVATTVPYTDPNSVMGIVFAWSFIVGSATGYLQLNCVKAVELQLAPRNNVIEPKISSAPGSSSKTLLSEVTAELDENYPNWRRRAVHAAMSGAARLGQLAWVNGNLLGGARAGMRSIMDG